MSQTVLPQQYSEKCGIFHVTETERYNHKVN